MKYQLLAVDVDGTLLNSNRVLTEHTKRAIHEAVSRGVVVAISTGRPAQAADYFSQMLSLPEMPFILYNGAMVAVGREHTIIYEQGLSAHAASTILSLGKELQTTMIVWSKNRLYVSEINDRIRAYQKITPIEPVVFTDSTPLIEQGITKIIWYDTEERVREFVEKMGTHHIRDEVNFHPSNPKFLEFVDKKASKALAMEMLGKYYSITRDEMIAVGDGYNDLSMLRYAGLSVAMENAPEDIKSEVDFVTRSNDEDGVAYVIEQFLL